MVKIFRTYLLCIVLAGISLMPVLVAIWYCTRQAINCHQMETTLQQDALETITLKTADIIWLKAGREILVGNKPFDVKRHQQIDDETVVTGLYDYKEKLLKEKLGNLTGGDRQHNRTIKITRHLFLFGPAAPLHFTSLMCNLATTPNYLFYNEHYLQDDYSFFIAPPPRFIFQI